MTPCQQHFIMMYSNEGAYVIIFDVLLYDNTLSMIKDKIGINACMKCIGYNVDVTCDKSVKNAVNKVIKQFGYIDVLVQCAGITGITGKKSHNIPLNNYEKVWKINVFGIFNVCKCVLPYMLKENYGRIINIASISGKEGNPGQASYSSSKGAVIALTKTMGKDYAHTGTYEYMLCYIFSI